ncbi:class F sortase [Paenibacillus peoriae]|uniref:class F sortase n=1 Tax=Paenibacillus peoriae TaxID=59893 RepID=UPI00026C682C|nr:class F sortase [Paenibacillus peoriae]MEC0180324.1 class F sortase [Paenibacillus peoriae]
MLLILLGSTSCSSSAEHHGTPTQTPAKLDIQQTKTTKPLQVKNKPFPGIIPHKIDIPAVRIHSIIEPVAYLENGQMGVPGNTDRVGYLSTGILPGAAGNAIMDGHVDTYTGPAVFYPLKKLKRGDYVYVTGDGGCKLQFVVESVKFYLTSEAPIQTIFGPTEEHRLNLITCAGRYSRSKKEHEGRLVVFTKLAHMNSACEKLTVQNKDNPIIFKENE